MDVFLYIFIFTVIISLSFLISLTIYGIRNSKKERLEIFISEDYIFFLISGDEFLKVFKDDYSSIEESIEETLKLHKNELSYIIDKIIFINYENRELEKRLYKILNINSPLQSNHLYSTLEGQKKYPHEDVQMPLLAK